MLTLVHIVHASTYLIKYNESIFTYIFTQVIGGEEDCLLRNVNNITVICDSHYL